MAARIPGSRLAQASSLSSGLLAIVVGWAAVTYESQVAGAEAADSFMDFATAVALAWSLRVSYQPADENHPFGHHRAQPIAALLIAMLAGGFAFALGREAIDAITEQRKVILSQSLVILLAVKVVMRAWIMVWSRRSARSLRSPVLEALYVDTRNDVLHGLVALLGLLGVWLGYPTLDGWAALPVAAWIGVSAILLGSENIRSLMGEAPPEERQQELCAIARLVTGVSSLGEIRARLEGSQIHVHIQVRVAADLNVQQAHDIGELVESRLLEEPDVIEAWVHIDVESAA